MVRNNILNLFAVVACGVMSNALHAANANDAYQLRMTGNLDDARKLLTEIVEANPNDAAAHFELARTEMHMALGEPSQIAKRFASARESIERAISHDPNNASFHSFAGHVSYFQAYYAMKMNPRDIKKHFLASCSAFERALRLAPESPHFMLYLVELHTGFPESAGADKKIANRYAEQLAEIDDVVSAKATSILSKDSCDTKFWNSLARRRPNNADVLEELAKACLRENEVTNAEKYINEAIHADAKRSYLYLDLSIFHTFRAMRARSNDKSLFDESVQAGNKAITKYLDSNPSRPMQAYAMGVQSKYKSVSGEPESGRKLFQQAKGLDPYFSKATGAPLEDLFVPINAMAQNHRYLMRPF